MHAFLGQLMLLAFVADFLLLLLTALFYVVWMPTRRRSAPWERQGQIVLRVLLVLDVLCLATTLVAGVLRAG